MKPLGTRENPYPLGPGECPMRGEYFDSLVGGLGYCDKDGKITYFGRPGGRP